MSDRDESADAEHSKSDSVKSFLKDGWLKSKEASMDGFLKGKIYVEHSLGLGHKPNVVPPGKVILDVEPRTVEVGWHPVGGFAGKWFAEKTGLGKGITKGINKYPDPTQHWAVLVGEYVHQLWMDEHLDIIYINEKIVREEWTTFEVGVTKFNDEALRQAGETTIFNMREKRAAYNLISNNCQNFALNLLDVIHVGAHKKFATSFAVYQSAIGAGSVKDLFVPEQPDEESATVATAQQVMNEHTTQLDNHHHQKSDLDSTFNPIVNARRRIEHTS